MGQDALVDRPRHVEVGVEEDLFRALYRLKAFPDAYLYVARPVNKGILSQLRRSEAAVVAYREAEACLLYTSPSPRDS